jgi:hypothetical protein
MSKLQKQFQEASSCHWNICEYHLSLNLGSRIYQCFTGVREYEFWVGILVQHNVNSGKSKNPQILADAEFTDVLRMQKKHIDFTYLQAHILGGSKIS